MWRSNGASSWAASAAGPMCAPKRCAVPRMISRLAASSSGACSCIQVLSALCASSSSRWIAVAVGAGTVCRVSSVTTPKRAPPAPLSAHSSSSSAVDDLAAAQNDARAEHLVAREAVQAPEDADPAAEREARDADGRAAPRGDRAPVRRERVVELAEPHARADGHGVAVDVDRAHRARVDQHACGRRGAGEVVTAAADRERLAEARGRRRRPGAWRTRRSASGLMCSNRAIAGRATSRS